MPSDLILSRITFDGSDRRARHALASRERLHAIVEAALDAGGSVKTDARRLWRLDHTRHGLILYTLADAAPDMADLQDRLGACQVESKPYTLPRLLGQGDMLRLTVSVNATKSIHGSRVPLAMDELGPWFRDRLERSGLTPLDVRVSDCADWRFGRHGRTVTLRAAGLAAVVRVADPAKAGLLLTDGVGRAKGYGLGMVCPTRVA